MPRCIAFLRAVNVGGRIVRMDALRNAFEALGLANVTTFIASGNVIFETRVRDLSALERRVEKHLSEAFGHEIDTFIRTDAELARLAAHEPFDAAQVAAAKSFVVGFLAEPPDAAAHALIDKFTSDDDCFAFHGRELYWLSRLGQSESPFSNAVFERALRRRSTFRSITTVRKLAALHSPKRG